MPSVSPTLTAIGVAALRALYTNMPGALRIVHDPFAASTLIATYTCPGLGARRFPTLHLRAIARLIGEPVRGELSTPELHAILEQHGLEVSSDQPVSRWAAPSLPGGLVRGPEWERLVVAVK
jgi:hypothetical protein